MSDIHVEIYGAEQISSNDPPPQGDEDSPSSVVQNSEGPLNFRLLPGAFNTSDENPHPQFEVSNIPNNNLISIYKDENCLENPIALVTPDGSSTAVVEVKGLGNGDVDFHYKLSTTSETSDCMFLGSKLVAGAKYVKDVYKSNNFTIALLTDDTLACWGAYSLSNKCLEYNLAGKTAEHIAVNRSSYFIQFTDGTHECGGQNVQASDCSSEDFNGASNTERVAKVYGNNWAMVAVLTDNSVICWGDGDGGGGDCSTVDFDGASNAETVTNIIDNLTAFAAILSDGSVVCWGDNDYGGNCSGVDFDGASNSETVVSINRGVLSFAALLSDGTVVCWGDNTGGGDCSGVDFDGVSNSETVTAIYNNYGAFAAVLSDNTVVCWGATSAGGNCTGVDFDGASNTETVQAIYGNMMTSNNDPNFGALAAYLSDGTMVCWGTAAYGGDCSGIDFDGASNSETVTKVVSGERNFAALLSDGTVVCWGNTDGSDCTSQDLDGADNAQTVVDLFFSTDSYVALLSDDTLVCWENSDCDGLDFTGINGTETIDKIYRNDEDEYVAMLTDGSLICWGRNDRARDCTQLQLGGANNQSQVTSLSGIGRNLIATLSDNTSVCIGDHAGANCNNVDLDGADNSQHVVGTYHMYDYYYGSIFSALLSDGTVECWGYASYGGDCSGVDFDGASNTETVTKIYALKEDVSYAGAFSAILSDGSVVCWGDPDAGNCSGVDFDGASNTETVAKMYRNSNSFSAVLTDGTVECWGPVALGGDCSSIDFDGASNSETITKITSSKTAFSVLLSDGTVDCWGHTTGGGDCSGVDFDGASNTETVQALYSNSGYNGYYATVGSFSALLTDGDVVCWGVPGDGGDCSGVDFDGADNSQTVTAIRSSFSAYAALLSDGTVVCWGDTTYGGDCSSVDFDGTDNGQTVTNLYGSKSNFTAILSDGTAVCWGVLTITDTCSSIDLNGETIVESLNFEQGVLLRTSGGRLLSLGAKLSALTPVYIAGPLSSVVSATKTSENTLTVEYLGGINISYYVGTSSLGSLLGLDGITPNN